MVGLHIFVRFFILFGGPFCPTSHIERTVLYNIEMNSYDSKQPGKQQGGERGGEDVRALGTSFRLTFPSHFPLPYSSVLLHTKGVIEITKVCRASPRQNLSEPLATEVALSGTRSRKGASTLLTSRICLCCSHDLCLWIIEIIMYRLPARTKPLSHILRRESRRSSFLSVRDVSSSFIPNALAASNLRATPRIQPFASVLISKLCTLNSGNFSGAISKSAADIFDEKILKLEPYHTALRNCVYTGNIAKMENIIVEMRTKGLSPTEETYDYLVAAHVRNKDFASALQTINGLKELGISHTTKIIVTLMRAYSESGDFDGAKKAYDDTISAGVVSGLFETY